jgi:hypothetical protein
MVVVISAPLKHIPQAIADCWTVAAQQQMQVGSVSFKHAVKNCFKLDEDMKPRSNNGRNDFLGLIDGLQHTLALSDTTAQLIQILKIPIDLT